MTRCFEEASYDGVPVISKIDEMDASNFKNLFESKIRQVILTSGEVFEAETVIVAAGYESRYITRTVGIDIPMTRCFEEASYDGVPVISKIDEMDASNFKNLFENLYNYEK